MNVYGDSFRTAASLAPMAPQVHKPSTLNGPQCPSLADGITSTWLQSQSLVEQAVSLVARLDNQGIQKANEGVGPELPLMDRCTQTCDNLNKLGEILRLLEARIFG